LNITFAMKRSIVGFAWSSAVEWNRSKAENSVLNLDVLNRSPDSAGTNVVGIGLWPGLVTT